MEVFDELWLDVNIATMSGENYGVIPAGAIGISGEKISWVGRQKDLGKKALNSVKKIHRGNNFWVTPGLIECHTHLVYGGNRVCEFEMRQKGVSYAQISKMGGGINATVQSTRGTSEDGLFLSARERLSGFLKEGVTTIEIKSGYGLDMQTELKMLRVATRLQRQSYATIQRTYLGAHAVPPEYKGRVDEYIDFLCNEVLPEIKKEELADTVDAFCENIAFNTDQVERLFLKAKKLGYPVKLHAEQLSDQKGAILAAKYQALSVDHLEYLQEDGIKAIAKSGTIAVLLPGASYYLNETKKPPLELLKNYKVPVAISTDLNPGTSPINSLLAVMNMACVLWKFTPEDALLGVTANSAKALGLGSAVGTIETGKKADFVVWDISQPAELSYGIGLSPHKIVVKNGKIIQ